LIKDIESAMAKRTLGCRSCSEVLDKEQRTEGVCKYCQLKAKIDKEIENIKTQSVENTASSIQLEELERMKEALALKSVKLEDGNMKNKVTDELSEKDENKNLDSEWKNDSSLPDGWKIQIDLNSMQMISIVSPDLKTFDNILSVFIYMANNQEKYPNENIEELKPKLTEEGWGAWGASSWMENFKTNGRQFICTSF
jgi:hypothetical protein